MESSHVLPLCNRKRRRRLVVKYAIVLATTTWTSYVTTSQAFVFHQPLPFRISGLQCQTTTLQQRRQLFYSSSRNHISINMCSRTSHHHQLQLQQQHQQLDLMENEKNNQSAGWLSWMISGRRSSVSDVRLREAEELGGIPRSDRYSSRSVHKIQTGTSKAYTLYLFHSPVVVSHILTYFSCPSFLL